jgi:hypothetical protein
VKSLDRVLRLLTVLWAGSLWSLAWVTQTLFSGQSDRHLAGLLASRLFSIETYLGLGVALIALLLPARRKFLWGYLAAALLAANEWALKPVMAMAREQGSAAGLSFLAWHGVSMLLYVGACLLLLLAVWKDDFR